MEKRLYRIRQGKQIAGVCGCIPPRLSTIKNADNIYVIDKGEIIEEGSHDGLILNENIYFNLKNEQK